MPSIAFNRPFDEQVDFFRRKLNIPAERYDSISRTAHDHAFMVAGAMQADLLADLRQAVDKAISQGGTLSQFQKDFDKIVNQYGWDYTGPRNWRTQVIYLTNLRTSYAAARWAQLREPDTLAARPLWRYQHSDSVINPRPAHQAWDGLILDATDAWWDTHYPPNGWGCQCSVVAIALDELADYGKTQSDHPPTDSWDTTGIDEGWDYAPGQSAADAVRLAESKIDGLVGRDETIARAYSQHLMDDGSFENWYADPEARVDTQREQLDQLPEAQAIKWLRENIDNRGNWPVAILSDDAKGWLNTDAKVVNFSTDTALKQIYKRGESLPTDQYKFLQKILDTAEIVVDQDNSHLVYFKKGDQYYTAIIKVTQNSQEVYLQSLHATSAKKLGFKIKKGRVIRDLLN